MNQEASHLVSRGELQKATERERFLKARQGGHKWGEKGLFHVKLPSFEDKRVLVGRLPHLPFGAKEGPRDGFLFSADQKIPGWLKFISLVQGEKGC